MREKSLRYENNSMCHKYSISIGNLEALRDIKSAFKLLHIYQRSFISNQKSHKGA